MKRHKEYLTPPTFLRRGQTQRRMETSRLAIVFGGVGCSTTGNVGGFGQITAIKGHYVGSAGTYYSVQYDDGDVEHGKNSST